VTFLGIPAKRLPIYLGVLVLAAALNWWTWSDDTATVVAPRAAAPETLAELPDLAISGEIGGFSGPPRRNLFRPAADEQPAPTPEPEPEPEPTPAPDPTAVARAEAERVLDSVSAIGFLATAEGVLAILTQGGMVINVYEGDMPIQGFRVSEVTIDSVTLSHRNLDLSRTYTLRGSN
jgi:hypothetical protein